MPIFRRKVRRPRRQRLADWQAAWLRPVGDHEIPIANAGARHDRQLPILATRSNTGEQNACNRESGKPAGLGNCCVACKPGVKGSFLAEVCTPEIVVVRIDNAVGVAVGGQRWARLTEALPPYNVIARIHGTVVVVIAEDADHREVYGVGSVRDAEGEATGESGKVCRVKGAGDSTNCGHDVERLASR